MQIRDFFKKYNKCAVAYSGGTDSSYLLYLAAVNNCDVTAYYVKTAFQPQFELDDAIKFTKGLDIKLKIIEHNIFTHDAVIQNPADRCYHCKTALMGLIRDISSADGYEVLLDGTNASDDEGDRPGMKALTELNILSPLKICGITKKEVIEQSAKAGLFTANKPANACLATRIPTGIEISAPVLARVEQAEDFLRSMGFSNLRVRVTGKCARIQLAEEQFEKAFRSWKQIEEGVMQYFEGALLDLTPRRQL